MNKCNLILLMILVLLLISITYLYLTNLIVNKDKIQTIIFPVGTQNLRYYIELSKNNNVGIEYYVTEDNKSNKIKEFNNLNKSDLNKNVTIFVVDGFFPSKKKLNMIYITPKLSKKELIGLINSSNRKL